MTRRTTQCSPAAHPQVPAQPGAEVEAGLTADPGMDAPGPAAPAGTPTPVTHPAKSSRYFRARRKIKEGIRSRATVDLALCLAYAAAAGGIGHGLWPDPANRALAGNINDQTLIEWFLAHGTLIWTGDFSLVTDRLNAPDGVNLMSNASHILHGALMAPVTAAFGAAVSFAILISLNLAATASSWYLLLARGLGRHRFAAFTGGAVAGFAPGMISQSNSHLHITAGWLVPPIIYCVIRLTRVRTVTSVITTGLGLGALISAQLLLGEEVLFLTAATMAVFALSYAVRHLGWVRRVGSRFLAGMALAAAVTILVCAYPLWTQFAGRQHTPNLPFRAEFFYADLATFTAFSPLSVAGSAENATLASSPAEYNTFLGVPLLIVLGACVAWCWRSPVAQATAVAGLVMAWLSLGPTVTYHGEPTGWPSLYQHIEGLPVIEGALPTRYALALIPLSALLLAQALDRAVRSRYRPVRLVIPVLVLAALAPLAPRPLATVHRAPVPTFITTGAWRQCVPEGGVLVPAPLPTPLAPDTMRWAAAADDEFALPQGFFIGPYGPGGRASIGIYPRPTSALLAEVAKTGTVPEITAEARQQARADVAYWRAECVALAPTVHSEAVRQTLDLLLGPGTRIADTWTWQP